MLIFLQITIITVASLAVAVLSALKFYSELKQFLSNHKPMAKLLAFKLIVGLTFIENVSARCTESCYLFV